MWTQSSSIALFCSALSLIYSSWFCASKLSSYRYRYSSRRRRRHTDEQRRRTYSESNSCCTLVRECWMGIRNAKLSGQCTISTKSNCYLSAVVATHRRTKNNLERCVLPFHKPQVIISSRLRAASRMTRQVLRHLWSCVVPMPLYLSIRSVKHASDTSMITAVTDWL